MSLFVNIFDGTRCCYDLESLKYNPMRLRHAVLEEKKLPSEDVQLLHNGRRVQNSDRLEEDGTYHIVLGLKGGKGGFGAMLRMIGAQIEKTTNREACRDLSGRRMRDVNNEKGLQDWIEKKKLQEEERERKRREKLDRMRSQPKHYFVDPSYEKQKEDVTESLEEAVSRGIEMAGSSGIEASASGGVKRKASDEDSDSSSEDDADFKKLCMWLGVDGADKDDSDADEGTEMQTCKQDKTSSKQIAEDSSSTSTSPPTSESGADEKSHRDESGVTSDPTADSKNDPSGSQTSASPDRKSLLSLLPPPSSEKTSSDNDNSSSIHLDKFSSVAELEELGMDQLKSALMGKGMKCGGTLQERAERLFSVKGLEQSEINPSLLAKPAKKKKGKK